MYKVLSNPMVRTRIATFSTNFKSPHIYLIYVHTHTHIYIYIYIFFFNLIVTTVEGGFEPRCPNWKNEEMKVELQGFWQYS